QSSPSRTSSLNQPRASGASARARSSASSAWCSRSIIRSTPHFFHAAITLAAACSSKSTGPLVESFTPARKIRNSSGGSSERTDVIERVRGFTTIQGEARHARTQLARVTERVTFETWHAKQLLHAHKQARRSRVTDQFEAPRGTS